MAVAEIHHFQAKNLELGGEEQKVVPEEVGLCSE